MRWRFGRMTVNLGSADRGVMSSATPTLLGGALRRPSEAGRTYVVIDGAFKFIDWVAGGRQNDLMQQ